MPSEEVYLFIDDQPIPNGKGCDAMLLLWQGLRTEFAPPTSSSTRHPASRNFRSNEWFAVWLRDTNCAVPASMGRG